MTHTTPMNKPDLKPSERLEKGLVSPHCAKAMREMVDILDELHEKNLALQKRVEDGERAMRIQGVFIRSICARLANETRHGEEALAEITQDDLEFLNSFLSPKE